MEPAALIPLQMLAPKGSVVLVGDPQQLPATVLSRAARKAGLALSLFERLQQVHMDSLHLRKAVLHPLMSGNAVPDCMLRSMRHHQLLRKR